MRKICLLLITTCLIISGLTTACGGGGGGAVSFQDNPGFHNGGGNSGWGTGNQTCDGFGGSVIENGELLISQMAALPDITSVRIELVINGVAQEAIIADATTKTDVLPKIKIGDKVSGRAYIYRADAEPRVAELDQTEIALHNTLKFKVPYNYECYDYTNTLVAQGTYYARDGINLSAQTVSPITGWQSDDGIKHYGSHLGGLRGDVILTALYGSPDCAIEVTPASGAIEVATGVYKITDLSQSFGFTLSGYSSLPATASLSWQVNGTPVSGAAPDARSASPNDASISDTFIGTNTGNASDIVVSCTISGLPGQPSVTVNKTIKVFKPVTLTGFDIYVDYNMYTGMAYPVYDTSTPINFSVFTAAGLPMGTVCNWTITNGTSGTSVQKQGDSVNVTPAEMGSIGTSESTASTWTVSCTTNHPDSVIPGQTETETLSPTFLVYKVTIPACSVSVQAAPTGAVANGDSYKVNDSSGSFTFKVSRTSNSDPVIPANSNCQWTITKADGTLYQPAGTTGTEINVSMSDLGYSNSDIPIEASSAKTITASCTISHDSLPASEAKTATSKTVMIYRQMVDSDFASTSVSTSASTGSYNGISGYLNTINDNTQFTFSVARSGGGSFPTGTTFHWEIWSGTSSSSWITGEKTLSAPTTTATFKKSQFGVSIANHGYQTRPVYCTVTLPGETDGYKVYITSVTFVQ